MIEAELHAYREGMLVVREMIGYQRYSDAGDLLRELAACRWTEARSIVAKFYRDRYPEVVRSFLTALDVLEGLSTAPLAAVRGTDASPSWWAAAASRADDDARWAHHALSRLALHSDSPRCMLDTLMLLDELAQRPDFAIPWPPAPGVVEAAQAAILARRARRTVTTKVEP